MSRPLVTSPAKRWVKARLGGALVRTGWWDLLLRTWAQRQTAIILVYHRVVEKLDAALDCCQPGMVVTAPTFGRQIAFLRAHFDIVPLGELLANRATAEPAGRPRCVITFDDGWRDNYDVASPILRQHGIPATIFLTTDFIGTARAFWHTELIHLLCAELRRWRWNGTASVACPKPVRRLLDRLAKTGGASCAAEVDPLIEAVKATCDEDRIDELIQMLARAAGLTRPLFADRRFFLDWDQVRALAAAGMEIGAHGCSHRILTRMSAEAANEELVRSKAEIEKQIDRVVQHFAFPNEAADAALVRSAAAAGYRTACLAGGGAGAGGSGIRVLQRLGMHEEVSGGGDAFDEARLRWWLFHAPENTSA